MNQAYIFLSETDHRLQSLIHCVEKFEDVLVPWPIYGRRACNGNRKRIHHLQAFFLRFHLADAIRGDRMERGLLINRFPGIAWSHGRLAANMDESFEIWIRIRDS